MVAGHYTAGRSERGGRSVQFLLHTQSPQHPQPSQARAKELEGKWGKARFAVKKTPRNTWMIKNGHRTEQTPILGEKHKTGPPVPPYPSPALPLFLICTTNLP